jgi:hypothetical protein
LSAKVISLGNNENQAVN